MCKICSLPSTQAGCNIYCNKCIEREYKRIAKDRDVTCVNIKKNDCAVSIAPNNTKFGWLASGKVTYDVNKQGVIIFNMICAFCELRNERVESLWKRTQNKITILQYQIKNATADSRRIETQLLDKRNHISSLTKDLERAESINRPQIRYTESSPVSSPRRKRQRVDSSYDD